MEKGLYVDLSDFADTWNTVEKHYKQNLEDVESNYQKVLKDLRQLGWTDCDLGYLIKNFDDKGYIDREQTILTYLTALQKICKYVAEKNLTESISNYLMKDNNTHGNK